MLAFCLNAPLPTTHDCERASSTHFLLHNQCIRSACKKRRSSLAHSLQSTLPDATVVVSRHDYTSTRRECATGQGPPAIGPPNDIFRKVVNIGAPPHDVDSAEVIAIGVPMLQTGISPTATMHPTPHHALMLVVLLDTEKTSHSCNAVVASSWQRSTLPHSTFSHQPVTLASLQSLISRAMVVLSPVFTLPQFERERGKMVSGRREPSLHIIKMCWVEAVEANQHR